MTARRAFSILTLACALVFMTGGRAMAQTMQSPLPPPTGYVNDYAGVIDSATKERLETTLTNLDREQQIQFAVVTIDSTKGRDIFEYTLAVARGWGIGSKDTGKPSLLLLVAIADRKYQDQVSRHLEGRLAQLHGIAVGQPALGGEAAGGARRKLPGAVGSVSGRTAATGRYLKAAWQ